MKTGQALILLLVICVSSVWGRHERDRERGRERYRYFRDLEPREPREEYRSEGGSIESWAEDYEALKNANLGAARITLNPRSLALPYYGDVDFVKFITRGSGRLGIIPPFGDRAIQHNVYKLKRGDVVAIPKGTPTWLYNDGDEEMEIVTVADTSTATQPGRFGTFLLAGGKDKGPGSVLQGFSEEILAKAWNVEKDTVSELLESQNGTVFIKVLEGIEFPDSSDDYNGYFKEFIYHLHAADPDVKVRDGGELRLVTSDKFPVLRIVHLGLSCTKLRPKALFAPSWSHNAHEVIYVVNGSARIQIVGYNGEQALDTRVREGSLVVIPRFFPATKLAGNDGFAYVSFHSNERPINSFLAGRNSVYKGIPEQVVARAFNIDDKFEKDIRERRKDEAIIFPPSSKSGRYDPLIQIY
ncbi:hypothetical protein O6H91_19G052400 [Diphasiastrum complanatum]|uniref:Uncharacterized protein n=1 Tax=Diphasiastrum complanatum TaxID=34168 RepID=A0ACC2AV61_DIPCM|nr:hypothetical protein O6H91_Y000600 [Diphasiastrum complanatum]KAJ7521407.1 hypothetical protein O6H91_19G052400 [Diphasiastrum complanatum]